MALFGKKKAEGDSGTTSDAAPPPETFSPQKAKAFFDRAQTVHDSQNFQYAMQLWLNGLGWDPTSMDAFEGYLRSSAAFLDSNPKGKLDKDFKSGLSAKGSVRKYVDALLDFGLKRTDAGAALKLATAAADCGLRAQAKLAGRVAYQLTAEDPKKQTKATYVKLLDALEKAEDYEAAGAAGEAAIRLDPSDGPLQARVRNMAAQATMSRGGFEDSSEGGFRRNIRDASQQEALEQQDSIAKSESVKDQIVTRTKAAYDENQDDLALLDAYARALLDRGRKPDLMLAMSLFGKAHKASDQFRYRERAGDAKLRLMRRNLEPLRAAAEKKAEDAAAKDKYEAQLKALRETELEELKLRVENYPTDLPLRFQLGRALVERGEIEDAIPHLQQAEADAKNRVEVRLTLAQAFQKLGGWEDAAIDAYRKALDEVPDKDGDLGLRLRYGLMRALRDKAETERSVDAAQEADKLAAGIAMKSFGYKDIREQRDAIKALIKDLGG